MYNLIVLCDDDRKSPVARHFGFPALYSRGREVKKGGGGGRNWGNDASADVDSAAATADATEAEGTGWDANDTNDKTEVCSLPVVASHA